MPPKKNRIPVVFDTNVIIGQLLSKTRRSANARVFDLWQIRRELQLIVSQPVIDEYLEIIGQLRISAIYQDKFRARLSSLPTVTKTNLGKRFTASRDPDDNVFLSTAHAGRAAYLITNDHDLLDISEDERKAFRFDIVTPAEFLRTMNQ